MLLCQGLQLCDQLGNIDAIICQKLCITLKLHAVIVFRELILFHEVNGYF